MQQRTLSGGIAPGNPQPHAPKTPEKPEEVGLSQTQTSLRGGMATMQAVPKRKKQEQQHALGGSQANLDAFVTPLKRKVEVSVSEVVSLPAYTILTRSHRAGT